MDELTVYELVREIKEHYALFERDLEKIENKTAQRRARKKSLELALLFKLFRKISIK